MKKGFSSLIRFSISFGLLALLGYLFRQQLDASLKAVKQADMRWIMLAAATYILFIWISAWRWQILLRAQGLKFTAWYLARVFTLGLFFCKLLPTSIGGDVMRIAYTTQPGKTPQAFSATFLDRLIGFQSLAFLAVVMALVVSLNQANTLQLGESSLTGFGMLLLLIFILALLIGVTLVLFNDTCHRLFNRLLALLSNRFPQLHRLTNLIDRSYTSVKSYRRQPLALTISFLSGIGVQASLAITWFLTARAVRGTVPLGYYLIFIPILNIIVNIPTIGGLGVREAAFVLFFTPQWLPNRLTPEKALSTAVLFLALDLVFAIIGGLFFALLKPNRVVPDGKPSGHCEERSDAAISRSASKLQNKGAM